MLKHQLIHPKINEILGRTGHHGKILIADGNYPASTAIGPNAEIVSLNLAPGLLDCCQVLDVLLTAVPVEASTVMGYPPDDPHAPETDPEIWGEYQSVLNRHGTGLELVLLEKWDFYEAVRGDDHVLTIQTGEQRIFGNLLLTIGVRL